MLASSLARLLDFLRSVGHTKPNAAHCFCAVAFQGGVNMLRSKITFIGHVPAPANLFRRSCFGIPAWRRSCFGVSASACVHGGVLAPALLHKCSYCAPPSSHSLTTFRHRTTALGLCKHIIGVLCDFASKFLPDGTPGQQQTSFGGEKYSVSASNLAHLGRIC